MPDSPSLIEEHISQIPALQVLANLGYECMPPSEAMAARGGKTGNVILETILEKWLTENNRITFKGNEYAFSGNNIKNAIRALKEIVPEGLVRDNEKKPAWFRPRC